MQTYSEVVKSNFNMAYNMADSEHAENVKKHVAIENVEVAEREFAELLKQIPDKDLRDKLDAAAGRLTFEYERLGFVVGNISEKAWACTW